MAEIIQDLANYVEFDKKSLLGRWPELPRARQELKLTTMRRDSVGLLYSIQPYLLEVSQTKYDQLEHF